MQRNTEPLSNTTAVPMNHQNSFVQDINVRSESDGKCCSITGSAVLSSSKLVLVDHENNKIKLVDMGSMNITSELKVSGYIWDVTVMNEDQIAVTDYNKHNILILKVTNIITLEWMMKVSGPCHGIDFSKKQLVVTYVNPSYIETFDIYGNLSNKIENDKDGNKLFKDPRYVCVSNDGDMLYVSDYISDKVVSLNIDGSVQAIYTDTDLKLPMKVCLDPHGNVYVCGCVSRNIHMLTPDCTKIKVILTQTDGLTSNVWSVSLCRQSGRLFVGMQWCDVVKVNQLS